MSGSLCDQIELSQLKPKLLGYSSGKISRPAPSLKFTGSNVFRIASPVWPLRISRRVLFGLNVSQDEQYVPSRGAGPADSSVARMISVPKTGSMILPPARGNGGSGGFR